MANPTNVLERPDSANILKHVDNILVSPKFRRRRKRLTAPARFLRFIVDETLAGREDLLKEYEIGVKALGRPESFDPQVDNVVRVEAGRLRKKLGEYYESPEGQAEQIRVEVPNGAYVPTFTIKYSQSGEVLKAVPQATNVNSRIYAIFGEGMVAFREHRWEDVINGTEPAVLLPFDEKVNISERRFLAALRFARIAAFAILQRYDQLQVAYDDFTKCALSTNDSTEKWQDTFGSKYYPSVLMILVNVNGVLGNVGNVSEYSDRLWKLADNDPGLINEIIKHHFTAVGGLEKKKLFRDALVVVNIVRDRLCHRRDLNARISYARTYYLGAYYFLNLYEYPEVLAVYDAAECNLKEETNQEIIGWLAWTGTEATRALRHLGRYDEADALAVSLKARFGDLPAERVRIAVSWALLERPQIYADQKDYEAALRCCVEFIERHDNGDHSSFDAALSFAYARKASCLRRLKRFDESIAEADMLVTRYGTSTDPAIQNEVAFAMVDKAYALRQGKRFAASVVAAKLVCERFGSATNEYTVAQRMWALHAIGDTRLCEAKLLLHSGLAEDAAVKLREAREHFIAVAQEDPREPAHFACKSYAEFLGGQYSNARETFLKALSVASKKWIANLSSRDWEDFDVFPIDKDDAFIEAARNWASEYSTAAKSTAGF